ncbi:MAG: ferrochelatase [Pseudomonadota bacterium]|jgi:ferrochelatase|nr:ferrochelatase [Pseudomonadota bacterium]|tara:strand:- start:1654 stop:2661 length:1008 start_codon:yes stop_codon:yes gene_type:complete
MKAILLVNLGSPRDLKLSSIKEYLTEFLTDDNVIDLPKIIQKILVKNIIVPFRSKKTQEAYNSIWKKDGSPLIINTKSLAKKLSDKTNYSVEIAMRYQYPSIKQAIEKLINKGCKEIIAVPLYPHYAQSTIFTTENKIKEISTSLGGNLKISFIRPFYNEEGYINALTSLIKESLPSDFDHLLFSYHGIPERHVKNTDPSKTHCLKVKDCCNIKADAHQFCYRHQVLETTKLCAKKLNIEKEKWSVSFQSRIGPGWLKPFTDKVLDELPEKNIKKLAVVCPAFVADNLETLEEINIRAREQFLNNGGIEFTYIPCLNDNNNWVDFLGNYIIQKGG